MAIRVFISYSHADQAHVERLHKHLAQLEREGTIAGWFDSEIHLASRLDDEIDRELAAAQIFLACASPDYIASEYCYDRELSAALAREAIGEIAIAPLILEPCDWLKTPLSKFKAVPSDGKPVSEFTNPNAAFLNVVSELRRLAQEMAAGIEFKSGSAIKQEATGLLGGSRYRVKRDHDELHKRDFVEQSFKEIYEFFKASAAEVIEIPDIEVRLSEFDPRHFQCTILNRGMKRSFETLHVRAGGSFGAIDILYGEQHRSNTSHGGFAVQSDNYELYFTGTMFSHGGGDSKKMTAREVAQLLWDDLLGKVGIDYA